MPQGKAGPITRRANALRRSVRLHTKQLLGNRVRILVEIRWRLGDEIMAIPIYEMIKQSWPNSELTVACSFPALLEDNPFVDKIIDGDAPVGGGYDRHIDLRNASRTVPRREHYALRADVPVPKQSPKTYWTGDTPPFDMSGLWIGVSTGATWSTKRWPLVAWQELCTKLHSRDCHLVQIGHGDDRIGLDHDYVDQTSVREAGAILQACTLFIGCDSGLLHLAAAVGTPAIGLFGPTDPKLLFDDALITIHNGRPCAACWNGPLTMREPGVCPMQVDDCMNTITVDTVFTAAMAALKPRKSADRCA